MSTLNSAAYSTARLIGGLAGLSTRAKAYLFRALVLPSEGLARDETTFELMKAGMVARDPEDSSKAVLAGWLFNSLSDAISDMVANAGADLLPQDEPTTIMQLKGRGHLVKGRSKCSYDARLAAAIMERTAFRINPRLRAILACTASLTRQDEYVRALIQGGMSKGLPWNPERFFLPVSFDYRGRMYYRGGVITPQGNDLLKGLIEFADPVPLGRHGYFALCMAFADAAGIKGSKVDVYDAVRALDHEQLEAYVTYTTHGWQAARLAMEIIHARQFAQANSGDFEDFESHVVVHQDATCSGLQIAAAITGHRPTAYHTNCVASSPSVPKQDIYGHVARQWAASTSELGEYAARYGRDMAKKAVMLVGYGAGKELLKEKVLGFLEEQGVTFVFDERTEQDFFDPLFNTCMASLAVKEGLMKVAQNAQREFGWETHDGFEVVHDKQEAQLEESVGTFVFREDYEWSPDLNITAVAPNFVHSLDAAQMREAVRELHCPVACVHDSLGLHAGNYVRGAKAVRQAFTAIDARSIAQELVRRFDSMIPLLGNYEPQEALESSYFWS